jgi:hypothetical protein
LDWSDDLEKYLSYFDQSIDADAYGREFANRLLVQYSSKDEIYEDVAKNKVKDTYTTKIQNVKTRKNSLEFFSMYYKTTNYNKD